MANELTFSYSIVHTKDPRVPFRPTQTIQCDQTGQGVYSNTLTIGTSAEDVNFGDVVPGLVILTNLDDTNYVQYGMSDGGTIKILGRLYPSKRVPAMFFLEPSATLRMIANTASCKVHVQAYYL